jgi:hypothetical protein
MPAVTNNDSDTLVLLDSSTANAEGEGFRRIYHTIFTFYCSGAGAGAVSLQASPNPHELSPNWFPIGTIAPGNTLTLIGVFPGVRAVKDASVDAKKVWCCAHTPPGR